MKNIKEFINKIKNKNTTTSVGASIARPYSKARPHTKTILITLPILILLIATLITITITNAAGNTAEPETDQNFNEDGDGYYIWVRAVDHAGNKGPWSEAQRVWIDNKGPSAPIIQGGSTAYALSRTISVKTEADDSGASGVAYYEYYKKSGSDKPDANAAGTKVTTSATSQKFDTNIAGEYVFFRAVDVVGNKGAWSDGQQVYIDVNKPTITVKQASLTITQGQSYNFSDYFTVAANGTNTSYTTTYKIGSTAYTNTSTLAVGTHTVTCTASKTGGNSNTETMTIVVESAGPASITTATSIQSATNPFIDGTGKNTVIVPGGFKVRTDLATTVDKGIVIEDSSSNQFVWVPIGTITKSDGTTVTIDLGRYTFASTGTPTLKQAASAYTSIVKLPDDYQVVVNGKNTGYIAELTVSRVGSSTTNATALNLAEFISKTVSNKGYYIARYEASSSSTGDSKSGVAPKNYITQLNASKAARAMYNGNSYVVSDLVNSYMWDTAIVFIQKCSTKTNYSNQYDGGKTIYKTGESSDVECNIYDLCGNLREFDTEYDYNTSGTSYATERGGSWYLKGSGRFTAARNACRTEYSGDETGFRVGLYVL